MEAFTQPSHRIHPEQGRGLLRPPEQVPVFLELLRVLHPQHHAMAFLGFCTGLRPSTMRPLRRTGESADVLWDQGRLLVRRSQTRGDLVLNTTKQKTRYSIHLPPEVIRVLRWHVEEQLTADAQKDSELLFPALTGGYRSPSVLNKPFAEVSEEMGLGYAFTQRGMRRTFNDLARAAEVQDLVTRSISGHLTERMQHHYSTVRGVEQQQGVGKVVSLMTRRAEKAAASSSGDHGGDHASEVVIQ